MKNKTTEKARKTLINSTQIRREFLQQHKLDSGRDEIERRIG
jgi:hypothetical protein